MNKDTIMDMLEASFTHETAELLKTTLISLSKIAKTHGLSPQDLPEYVALFSTGLVETCDDIVAKLDGPHDDDKSTYISTDELDA